MRPSAMFSRHLSLMTGLAEISAAAGPKDGDPPAERPVFSSVLGDSMGNPASRTASADLSQTMMLPGGTPAFWSAATTEFTRAICVENAGPPLVAIFKPTTSEGAKKFRHALPSEFSPDR